MLYSLQATKVAPKQFAEMKQMLIEKYGSLDKCKHVLRNKTDNCAGWFFIFLFLLCAK